MCIIQKTHPKDNTLGQRRVVGQIESITSDLSMLNGTTVHDSVKNIKESKSQDIFSMIAQVEKLEHIITEKRQAIETLNGELSSNELKIELLKTKNESLESQIDQLKKERTSIETSNQDLAASLSKKDMANNVLQEQIDDLKIQKTELVTENEICKTEKHAKSQEIENLRQEYEKIQLQMTNMEDELISYVYSKSWRWTRPLRKLMSWISGK
jgi:chromosome segregation ATPase